MSDAPEDQVPPGAAVFPVIPAELGIHPLLLAVLHATVFISGSDEEIVDRAASDEALQHMTFYLQRLSGADRRRLQEDVEALFLFARREKWAKQELLFLKNFLAQCTGSSPPE